MKIFGLPRLSFILLLLTAMLPVSAAKAQPAYTTYYAAIAFSDSTGRYGYTSGWRSDVNARRDAIAKCKADDARVLFVVGNGYVALALGDDPKVYGYGYGETADEAKRFALESCRKRTTNCHIAICVHSWAG